jgi:hypothetical protein
MVVNGISAGAFGDGRGGGARVAVTVEQVDRRVL